jgi:hypothetical protein
MLGANSFQGCRGGAQQCRRAVRGPRSVDGQERPGEQFTRPAMRLVRAQQLHPNSACCARCHDMLHVPGVTPHSRGAFRVRVLGMTCPRDDEGAGNAGRWPHPWPACRKNSRRQSPQVSRDIPAFPARWLYGLLRALPRDRLSCPCSRVMRSIIASATMRTHCAWLQHREARTTRLDRAHRRRSSA